jgi:hypothetical protein
VALRSVRIRISPISAAATGKISFMSRLTESLTSAYIADVPPTMVLVPSGAAARAVSRTGPRTPELCRLWRADPLGPRDLRAGPLDDEQRGKALFGGDVRIFRTWRRYGASQRSPTSS